MSSRSKSEPSLFVLHYKERRVLIELPKDYDLLQNSIRRHFPEIPEKHRVSYHTRNPRVCEGALTEISPDFWGTIIPLLKSVIVLSEPTVESSMAPSKRNLDGGNGIGPSENSSQPPAKKLRSHTQQTQTQASNPPPSDQIRRNMILNIDKNGERLVVKCHSSMSIYDILAEMPFKSKYTRRLDDYAIILNGAPISVKECKQSSVEKLGLENGDTIEVSLELKGGKPVIYLLPPAGTEIDATVKLSLVPEWHLSAVYPVVPINSLPSGGEMLRWDVRAFVDGTLLEKASGLEVAYLFWEAEALVAPSAEDDDDRKSLGVDKTFIPNKPKLDPLNSVVLDVANMTPYLDRALKVLGLHTEARTSFITYWLPSFLKHKYVALQFLSQSVYERAAPLEVTPSPDVVVRVFMLFKGLKANEVAPGGKWSEVVDASKDNVTRWRDVVGVNESRSLTDGSLFRVVEWGGMEVLS